MRIGSFLVAAMLVAMLPASIYSDALPTMGVYWHSPMGRYSGYTNVSYEGLFHHQIVQPYEDVFYLDIGQNLLRLIFYCRGEQGPAYVAGQRLDKVWQYCTAASQLNVTEGQRIIVRGTVIEPSQWKPELSTPRLVFFADLYVMTTQIAGR